MYPNCSESDLRDLVRDIAFLQMRVAALEQALEKTGQRIVEIMEKTGISSFDEYYWYPSERY